MHLPTACTVAALGLFCSCLGPPELFQPAVDEGVVAFARHLQSHTGARPVGMRFDYMRFDLPERSRSSRAALRLAWESFLYCPDAVYQGSGTLEALAERLQGSESISFWWD